MRIAIIGGSGKMGRWSANFLLKDGKEVVITGRNQEKLLAAKQQLGVEIVTNVDAAKSADVILLSVPPDNFEAVVEEIHHYIQPQQIVIDITSIKALPVEIMHRYIKTGLTLGVHPMFGPGAESIANQRIILTPTNTAENTLAQKIRGYLESKEARVALMSPQEHDDLMTLVLGLAHFIALVSADTLLSFDKLKLMKDIGGSTYRILLTLVEGVVSEDPEFYASLQMSLPNMIEAQRVFQRRLKTWADLVENKNKQEFIQRMSTLRSSFEKNDPDFGKAYENIYKLIQGL